MTLLQAFETREESCTKHGTLATGHGRGFGGRRALKVSRRIERHYHERLDDAMVNSRRQAVGPAGMSSRENGNRGGEIRTLDLLVPNQAR